MNITDKWISDSNVARFLEGADIALSAWLNFRERRVLNRACVRKGVPMLEGAMDGMEAYLFTVIPRVTPCLDCVFPGDDPEWQELGIPVFGAVSGMLGCLMAIEEIKVLTGFGKPMLSKMLTFNMIDMHFMTLNIHRNEHCSSCGESSDQL